MEPQSNLAASDADGADLRPGDSGDLALLTSLAQTVLQATSDGVFLLDEHWRFSYLNAAAERLLGRGPGELLGLGVWEEFPEAVGSAFDVAYRRARATGTPVTFDEYFAPLDTTFEVRAFPRGLGLAVFMRDVADDRRLRAQQQEHAQLTRAILDSLPAHTVVLAMDGTITSTNQPWEAFGCQEGGDPVLWSAGANYLEVCRRAAAGGDGDAAAVLVGLAEVLGGTRGSFTLDYECSSPTSERWFTLLAVPLVDRAGVILSHTEVTARVLSQRWLAHQAHHDHLTGLPNRLRLLQVLSEALAARQGDMDIAVLFVDLDGFKNVNDSLGHDAGDALLKDVAGRLGAQMRGSDIVARLGGDEFVVVAQDCDVSAARRLADRLRQALAEPFDVAGMHLPLTASIGIALGGGAAARPMDLLRQSDIAMFAAKDRGRDRSHLFSVELGAAANDRLTLAASLRTAIRRDELFLDYQAIVSLGSGGVHEVEALMRWNHPDRGLLPPGAFIALAEETGLIVPISRWLLGETLCQVAAWSRDGVELTVAVNVAAQHLSVGTLFDDVTEALGLAGVAPGQLVVELTESDVARDIDGAREQLVALRRVGVRVAMDDFGSGYSSLGQLASLPVDIIKIDRSLVQDLGTATSRTASTARTLIAAVTSIAETLGMTTVAEGIETAEQHRAVIELGCTHAQGYLFARPMPAHDLRALLPQRSALSTRSLVI